MQKDLIKKLMDTPDAYQHWFSFKEAGIYSDSIDYNRDFLSSDELIGGMDTFLKLDGKLHELLHKSLEQSRYPKVYGEDKIY